MLCRAVDDLEQEATDRVRMLQEKIELNAKLTGEVCNQLLEQLKSIFNI